MKVVCTLSGGSDSAYAAFVAKQKWPDAEFHSLFVDYGQPEVRKELLCSSALHGKLGFCKFGASTWHKVEVDRLYDFDREDSSADTNSLYVPHRNLVIASIGAALADKIGAEKLVVGNKSFRKTEGDFLTYDGNREFYKALEMVVRMAQVRGKALEIVPTLSEFFDKKLTREDVYFGLWGNGFQYLDTFSCWYGATFLDECGTCKNCKEKREIWERWIDLRAFNYS